MDQEIEVKFYLASPDALRQRVIAAGAELVQPRVLERNLRFDTEAMDLRAKAQVLRLNAPETLQALRESPAASFLGDALGPASVIVREGGLEKVRAALARLGCLTDLEELPQ